MKISSHKVLFSLFFLVLKISSGKNEPFPLNSENDVKIPQNLPCSVPDNRLSADGNINCNYRGKYLPAQIFRWNSGNGCYVYIQPHLFKKDVSPPIQSTCWYQDYSIPCFMKNSTDGWKCYPVDDTIPFSHEEVQRTVISKFVVERWKRCIHSAVTCCIYHMNQNNLYPGPGKCPSEWDGWTCWPPGISGHNSKSVCPEFAYSHMEPSCYHYSKKSCDIYGSWKSRTDYSSCSASPILLSRLQLHVACLSLSLIAAIPALVVLSTFKDFKLTLHRNLLAAIVIRNIFVIINKTLIIREEITSSEPTMMSENGGLCKALTFFEKVAAQTVFSCMLMEGIYLHRKIVAVFKKDINIKHAYMWLIVITMLPVIVWMSLMISMNDSKCWMVYIHPGFQWVLNGPRIIILVINSFLYFDILRIFFTKMRREENKLNTAKATLFLFPLFGLHFLITFWYPPTTNCSWEQFYFIVAYSLDGLQGVIVAVLYCYLNKEVQLRIRAWFQRAKQMWVSRRDSLRVRIISKRVTLTTENPETRIEDQDQRKKSYRDSGVDVTDLNLDDDEDGPKIPKGGSVTLGLEAVNYSVAKPYSKKENSKKSKNKYNRFAECYNKYVSESQLATQEQARLGRKPRSYSVSFGDFASWKQKSRRLSITGSIDSLKKWHGYEKMKNEEGSSTSNKNEDNEQPVAEFNPDKMCPNRENVEKTTFLKL